VIVAPVAVYPAGPVQLKPVAPALVAVKLIVPPAQRGELVVKVGAGAVPTDMVTLTRLEVLVQPSEVISTL
jgi:hypothetical protein